MLSREVWGWRILALLLVALLVSTVPQVEKLKKLADREKKTLDGLTHLSSAMKAINKKIRAKHLDSNDEVGIENDLKTKIKAIVEKLWKKKKRYGRRPGTDRGPRRARRARCKRGRTYVRMARPHPCPGSETPLSPTRGAC